MRTLLREAILREYQISSSTPDMWMLQPGDRQHPLMDVAQVATTNTIASLISEGVLKLTRLSLASSEH